MYMCAPFHGWTSHSKIIYFEFTIYVRECCCFSLFFVFCVSAIIIIIIIQVFHSCHLLKRIILTLLVLLQYQYYTLPTAWRKWQRLRERECWRRKKKWRANNNNDKKKHQPDERTSHTIRWHRNTELFYYENGFFLFRFFLSDCLYIYIYGICQWCFALNSKISCNGCWALLFMYDPKWMLIWP